MGEQEGGDYFIKEPFCFSSAGQPEGSPKGELRQRQGWVGLHSYVRVTVVIRHVLSALLWRLN
jgi:hypothetical protein